MELIEKAEKARVDRGLNDSQFARLLCINHGYWSRLKRGERPIGLAFLEGIVQNIPELQADVLTWLATRKRKRL